MSLLKTTGEEQSTNTTTTQHMNHQNNAKREPNPHELKPSHGYKASEFSEGTHFATKLGSKEFDNQSLNSLKMQESFLTQASKNLEEEDGDGLELF
jgi:hypothetical protein